MCEEMKPLPNNCKTQFYCNSSIKCLGKKTDREKQNCKYQTEDYFCENVILQVNAAVNFIKSHLGEEDFIKYVLKEIDFYKKIDELEKEWSDNWDFADGYRKCIDDIKSKFIMKLGKVEKFRSVDRE